MSEQVPSEAAKRELVRLAAALQTDVVSKRIWERHLTETDRSRLGGDYSDAYRALEPHWGGIGIWMRVRGITHQEAVLELAEIALGLNPHDVQWLRRELGNDPPRAQNPDLPEWNRDLGELRFRGSVVRKVRSTSHAKRVVAILDAFARQGWPRQIDDPSATEDRFPEDDPLSLRLHSAIKSLNNSLKQLRFRSDGRGSGVRWEVVDQMNDST